MQSNLLEFYNKATDFYLKGDFETALEYHKQFKYFNDTLFTIDKESAIAELQAVFEVTEKEKENQFLRQERMLQESRLNEQRNFLIVVGIAAGLLLVLSIGLIIVYRNKIQVNRLLHQKNEMISLQQKNLEAANHKLSVQQEDLKALNHTKDKFFSIIAHDLRGPLSSLSNFTDILVDDADSFTGEELKDTATVLRNYVDRVAKLLENLLAWARTQTGNIKSSPREICLSATLRRTAELYQESARQKEINLRVTEVQNAMVFADAPLVETVVRNLLSNAIKFTERGGEISLEMAKKEQGWLACIKDSGVGMTPEEMDKIFRIDKKHTSEGTEGEKGTGLGMILCREFLELQGGSMEVDSEPSKGTVVSFWLPSPAEKQQPAL